MSILGNSTFENIWIYDRDKAQLLRKELKFYNRGLILIAEQFEGNLQIGGDFEGLNKRVKFHNLMGYINNFTTQYSELAPDNWNSDIFSNIQHLEYGIGSVLFHLYYQSNSISEVIIQDA